ncbi:MAG: hypothetical protein IJ788_07590 [Oscillospiraceae bacterium]|nr:hypothetical protein [Oscillospiraceae bacterium]
MKAMLIVSGIWNIFFALAKWSLQSKNQLLKFLCIINGILLVFVVAADRLFGVNDKLLLLSFYFYLFVVGAMMDFKYITEKNTFSFIAVITSIIFVVGAIEVLLFADYNNAVSACLILTGCTFILSVPYEKLYEKLKSDKTK